MDVFRSRGSEDNEIVKRSCEFGSTFGEAMLQLELTASLHEDTSPSLDEYSSIVSIEKRTSTAKDLAESEIISPRLSTTATGFPE